MLLLLLGAAALVILLAFYRREAHSRPEHREILDGEIEHSAAAKPE